MAKLHYAFLLYRDVVKEYRGRFEGKVIICDKVDYLLSSQYCMVYGQVIYWCSEVWISVMQR